MINLKTSKSAMYFSPWSYQATGFPATLQPLEKPVKQPSCYKSIFGCQYQLLEDRKHKALRNH